MCVKASGRTSVEGKKCCRKQERGTRDEGDRDVKKGAGVAENKCMSVCTRQLMVDVVSVDTGM